MAPALDRDISQRDWSRWRKFLNRAPFVVHLAASIYLLIRLFENRATCKGDGNRHHYAEQYVQGLGNILDGASTHVPLLVENATSPYAPQPVLQRHSMLAYDNGTLQTSACEIFPTNQASYSMCLSTLLLDTLQVPISQWNTLTLGASNNILYLMLLFEWFSAGFALFYLDLGDFLDAKRSKDESWEAAIQQNPRLDNFASYFVIAWDLLFIILTWAFSSPDWWNVPSNNVLLGVLVALGATAVHVVYTLPMGRSVEEREMAIRYKKPVLQPLKKRESRSDSVFTTYWNSFKSIFVRKPAVLEEKGKRNFFRRTAMTNAHFQNDVIETNKIRVLDYRMTSTEIRYWEYALTAPCLMLAIQSTVFLNSPVWVVQTCFVAIMVTNLLGVPLHQCIVLLARIQNAGHKSTEWLAEYVAWAAAVFLASSWLAFSAAWIPYMQYYLAIAENLPDEINFAVLSLLIFYIQFGAAATVVYGSWINNYKKTSWTLYALWVDTQSLSRIYDILSLGIKIAAASSVVFSDQFGPSSWCTD